MACHDFVNTSWIIQQTQGRIVQPFVPDNVVRVSEPSEDSYTVAVYQGTVLQGTYPGFICSGSRLDGKAADNALRLTMTPEPGRAQILGEWDPEELTTGTWTGDEGGGGGGSDEA